MLETIRTRLTIFMLIFGFVQNDPKCENYMDYLIKDSIFSNENTDYVYDNNIHPTDGQGIPTNVSVNFFVNSISVIDASSMDYIIDVFFRQKWQDHRLSHSNSCLNNTTKVFKLNSLEVLNKIWKPDLYFVNVKEAHFHEHTVPNVLVWYYSNGELLVSLRYRLKLSCPMYFHNFPFDEQRCPFLIESYAYTEDEVKIKWHSLEKLNAHSITIPEFRLKEIIFENSQSAEYNTGLFSRVSSEFVFVRLNGFHLIQTYFPTILIVSVSWVSFWLDVNAIPARVTLGVTTLLTLTTLASAVRENLPPVSYIKAIDVWIGVCSFFIFGALLEFTMVNYYTRLDDVNKIYPIELNKTVNDDKKKCQQWLENTEGANFQTAVKIDKISRILFPTSFLIFNLTYWTYYLSN